MKSMFWAELIPLLQMLRICKCKDIYNVDAKLALTIHYHHQTLFATLIYINWAWLLLDDLYSIFHATLMLPPLAQ